MLPPLVFVCYRMYFRDRPQFAETGSLQWHHHKNSEVLGQRRQQHQLGALLSNPQVWPEGREMLMFGWW